LPSEKVASSGYFTQDPGSPISLVQTLSADTRAGGVARSAPCQRASVEKSRSLSSGPLAALGQGSSRSMAARDFFG
jgi:hypothetical protein